MNIGKVLVWCHGGCFSGGSVEYDKELRDYLNLHYKWQIYCVDFSLNDWDTAIEDIIKVVKIYANTHHVVLGGVSSGGLLAHETANRTNLRAILLCPVIKPATRHDSLSNDLQEKQLNFFKTMDNMIQIEKSIKPPNNKRFIIYGKTDTRAPVSAYSDWLKQDNITCYEENGGPELCNKPPYEIFAQGLNNLVEK